MLKKARLLTRPTLAATSPAHPEPAKADPLPLGRALSHARPQRAKQVEVEVKVEQWSDFPHLSLSVSLFLMLADFFSLLLRDDVAHKIIQCRIGDLDLDDLPCCS